MLMFKYLDKKTSIFQIQLGSNKWVVWGFIFSYISYCPELQLADFPRSAFADLLVISLSAGEWHYPDVLPHTHAFPSRQAHSSLSPALSFYQLMNGKKGDTPDAFCSESISCKVLIYSSPLEGERTARTQGVTLFNPTEGHSAELPGSLTSLQQFLWSKMALGRSQDSVSSDKQRLEMKVKVKKDAIYMPFAMVRGEVREGIA